MRKLLGIIFILVIIGFMVWVFFLKEPTTYENRFIDAVSPQQSEPTVERVETTVVAEDVDEETCEETLRAEVEKKDIEYQRGSILLAYENGVTFGEAVEVLSEYNLKWSGTQSEESGFDDRGWLTAVLMSGDEFEAICSVRNDAAVRSATLNVLFELHQ